MRGPKNIVRTAAEFALEHRGDLSVYLGSPVEVAATLYQLGLASLSPWPCAHFGATALGNPLVKRLALAAGPDDLANRCEALGLPLSGARPRRILDGAIAALDPLTERLAAESFPRHGPSPIRAPAKFLRTPAPCVWLPRTSIR